MTTPFSALNTAVNRFANTPGVTPAQVAELRDALRSDPDLTQRLDKAASTGTLRAFAPPAPGAAARPVGEYDPASGTVTLPTPALSAPGAPGSGDLHAVLRVQSMVVDFSGKAYIDTAGTAHPVTADMLSNLQDTLNGSPALAEQMKRAATTIDPQQPRHRILESFAFTAPGAGVGGSFNASAHTMNLVSESLVTVTHGFGNGSYEPNDLTFVIGHEVQHGFNAQAAAQARGTFVKDVRALATSTAPVHDYTTLVERHIQSGREDEAKAEIAGWNALRSRVEHDQGSVSLAGLDRANHSRTADFIEFRDGAFAPRANVQLNADLTMNPTPANVAAMGYNYFDRPVAPKNGDTRQEIHLGHNGVEDYPNYYAGWAVATISFEEQAASHRRGQSPQVQINMARIGLDETMMEKAGLNLAPSRQSLPYLDSSTQPAAHHRFDHTADGPNQYQHVPVAPSKAPAPPPPRLDDPSHADHAFYQQVRGHVVSLDRSMGRAPDQFTDQIASALTVQARADGMNGISEIALSADRSRLWAVQTPPGRKDHLFDLSTSVATDEATTPMEHSAAKWPDAMQKFEQTQQEKAMSQQASLERAQARSLATDAPVR